MSRLKNVYEWVDLLHHATNIGYSWNQAHDILVKDEVPPMYESNYKEYYVNEILDRGFSEDTIKILVSFIEKEKITDIITII